MARRGHTRVPDDEVRAAVAKGFLHAVGRAPTATEIETLRPLWAVAGYDDGDVIWGLVFLFARQLTAAEAQLAQLAELQAQTTNTFETESAKVVVAARRALSSRAVFVHTLTKFAVANVLAVALVAAFATWWVYVEGERAGRSAAVEIARAHSPTLLSRLYDYPALSTEDLQWCDSEHGRQVRAVCDQKAAFLDTPLARASFVAYDWGLGSSEELVNLILCQKPPLVREQISPEGVGYHARCWLPVGTWRWAVPRWSPNASEIFDPS